MLRQEKRQKQRHQSKLEAQFDKVPEELMVKIETTIRNQTIGMCHCLYAMALNSNSQFGKKRINKTIDSVMSQFDGLKCMAIEPQQITEWCVEKGVNFTKFEI